ncbi:hypothetical protein Q4577_11435 [Marinovum sp. 2_MG-2023]|uniref:hypothetical protein n=1 Tax=unclassified Marinovum TaxID=2647166 RepID=UPI0026E14215|nr:MULTISPECIES: hypothetical protein [unclassified Marinovum]MDO6730633.1 hypothetical protein [Marinovum sp. 2_MG-2023]MDO6778784.1 hypothetical protein [Marinovum sp. 1_MG-2023]
MFGQLQPSVIFGFLCAILSALWLSAGPLRADMSLIMVEEPGCIWCARWNADIAPIYPKTPEGRAAPLMRIDIRDNPPETIEFARSFQFTPTFVLVVDGQESARIEGYPGEDFFWGLLGRMIRDATTTETAG